MKPSDRIYLIASKMGIDDTVGNRTACMVLATIQFLDEQDETKDVIEDERGEEISW